MSRDFTHDSRWRRLRLEIIARDGGRCQIGGPKCRVVADEVDHIVPVEDGGAIYDPANLRAACGACNTWRAQLQKARDGWRRASTRITLVIGPPGSCDLLTGYVHEHAGQRDLIVDYRAIAAAIGDHPDAVKRLRGQLLTQLRRGDLDAARAWLTSTNPRAETMFPHHEVVVVDPGLDYALAHVHRGGEGLVRNWYAVRGGEPAGWEW